MSAKIIKPANITLAIADRGLSTEGIVADPELSTYLKTAIANFVRAIQI